MIQKINQVSLYRNSTFIGRVDDIKAVIMVAIAKYGATHYKRMFQLIPLSYSLITEAKSIKDIDQAYFLWKDHMHMLPRTVKTKYVKENSRGRYNKYEVLSINNIHDRIVFDTDENNYRHLYIIPRGSNAIIERVYARDMIATFGKIYNKVCYKITLPENIMFPRTEIKTQELGLLISKNCDINSDCFEYTNIKKVINRLEKMGFSFKKDACYKSIVGRK